MGDQWRQKIDAVTGRFTYFPFAVHPVAGALDWLILVDQRPEYADEAWIVLEQPAAVCAAWAALPRAAEVMCWWQASSPGVSGATMWWGGRQRAGIINALRRDTVSPESRAIFHRALFFFFFRIIQKRSEPIIA